MVWTNGVRVAVWGLMVVVASGIANAQSSDDSAQVAARRGLLSDAQAASHSGDHAQALELALRAGRIEMTPSVRLFIAQEHQALGHIAEALGSADLCVREAQQPTTLNNREAILGLCRTLLDTLTRAVGRIVVHTPANVPTGFAVTIGGTAINDAFYGVPYRVTPGEILIEATAPTMETFRQRVTVAAGASIDVTVAVTIRAVATTASASPSSSRPLQASAAPAHQTTTSHSSTRTQSASSGGSIAIPVALIAAGVVIAGLGGVFLFLRGDAINTLNTRYCDVVGDTHTCEDSPGARSTYSSAQLYDLLSPVAFAVGAVAIVAGAVVFVLGRHSSSTEQQHARLDVFPTQGGLMLTFGGAL